MPHAELPGDLHRLRRFWDQRYRTGCLSESGWVGASPKFNEYIYRCKTAAVERALRSVQLTDTSAFAVLDAGCGLAYFADYYARAFPRATYTGIDLSKRVIEHLHTTRPSLDVREADISTWRPDPPRQFDVIQCLEVLLLIFDDAVVQRTFANFAKLLKPGGHLLATARRGESHSSPHPHLHHRPESQLREWWTAAGLKQVASLPIYYWMPDGGPSWRLTQPIFFRLPASIIYALDRAALRLDLPRARTGPDSQTELIVLGHAD